jgi:alanyl-tRNA synthetase
LLDLQVNGQSSATASQGDEVDIILTETPFYGEMGGQVGDVGEISGSKGKVAVTNTIRTSSDVIIHQGRVMEGSVSVGDEVEAKIDVARRLDIARNHTATHLLQAALRNTLGSHVSQRGSLVEPARFRFDFSHLAPISEEQVGEIQRWVNERIRQDLPVKTGFVPYKQAVAEGAIALFEEKYGERVRVVEIGEPTISKELCGGTHVKSTGEIGLLIITGESSIGTGLRRIEAATGRAAESLVEQRFSVLQSVSRETGSLPEKVLGKVKSLARELEVERQRSLSLEKELSRKAIESLVEQTEAVDGVTVLVAKVSSLSMPVLREMGDMLRARLGSAIVVLATAYGGKPSFLAMVTPDLAAKGFHAGNIVKQMAEVTGGGGGGKASMAQAGGRDIARIDEALNSVKSIVASQISSSLTGEG